MPSNAIKNYIMYLRKECGLAVTVHISNSAFTALPESLISFNIHDNPYCVCIKSNPQAHKYCIECQKKVSSKAMSGAYIGVCHAGVKEFVYPVSDGKGHIGFLSISGYKAPNADGYIRKTAEKLGLSQDKLSAAYTLLKDEMPAKPWVDTLITPLLSMLELALIKAEIPHEHSLTFSEKIAEYLQEHRNEDITSTELCRHFSCSRSFLSREFNRQFGKSIPQYRTELRINDAKILLKSSRLTVTEIAFSVGYGDSNYFSNLFKNQVGMTPKEYRNKNY